MKRIAGTAFCAALLSAVVLAAGCVTRPVTTLDVTWVTPQLPPAPKKLLIISVAGDEFFQIAFQDQMAEALQARGVNAVASKSYFTKYTTAERERFKQTIQDSGADFVLVARVTDVADSAFENRGTYIGRDGVPYADDSNVSGIAARYFNPSSYVPGADATTKAVTAEASIFATKDRKLIWSARTHTTDAQSRRGTDLAPPYVAVILEAMKKDKVF
jgi:hypothetical protein